MKDDLSLEKGKKVLLKEVREWEAMNQCSQQRQSSNKHCELFAVLLLRRSCAGTLELITNRGVDHLEGKQQKIRILFYCDVRKENCFVYTFFQCKRGCLCVIPVRESY